MVTPMTTTQNIAERETLSSTLREVGAENEADLAKVAALHMELLGFGPVAGLGERFIRDIGYRAPLRDGLLRVILCEVNGEPAGFIAFTDRSGAFHQSSLRQHFFPAARSLLVSILHDPSVLLRLGPALHLVFSRSRDDETHRDPLGEVISIAARPKFASAQISKQLGFRLSEKLVRAAARSLHNSGVASLRGIVDSDNKAPQFFYRRLGAELRPFSGGKRAQTEVWFDDLTVLLEGADGPT